MTNRQRYFDCIEAMQSDITDHFDGYRMNDNIAKNAVKNFDFDTVKIVLANSISLKTHDGRISDENKNWAKSIVIPIAQDQRHFYILDGNAGLLNIVANQFRALEKERERPKKSREKEVR